MKKIVVDNLEFEPFITYEQIQKRIRLIGVDINMHYEDLNPVFIGVLNGAFMFMADLMKVIQIPSEMSFVKLASYEGTSQGNIHELIGVGMDLTGRNVIIVEDVVDTGNSLVHTISAIEKLGAASISICTLLYKPDCVQYTFENLQYVGFEIEKEFVIGYGLDLDGQFRNLPDIYRETSMNG